MQRLVLGQMECFCFVAEEMHQARYGLFLVMIEGIHLSCKWLHNENSSLIFMKLINESLHCQTTRCFQLQFNEDGFNLLACLWINSSDIFMHLFWEKSGILISVNLWQETFFGHLVPILENN